MSDFLPTAEPSSVLPLISADRALTEGAEKIPIPPVNPESVLLLHHAGIRQAVYQGTGILDRLCDKPHSQTEHFPPTLLYRHILDLGDSIATLLRFGSASSGAILLRSLHESVIGLEFILKDYTLHHDRSLCYWVCFRIKQYETYMKHDPSTSPGEEFHRLLDNDPTLRKAKFPRADYSKQRESLEQHLSDTRFKPIWDRYKTAKKKNQKREWYSLCSEAKNVRELAREIGREAEYALMYQHCSEFVHGTDVITGTLKFETEKGPSMHQIRGPITQINTVASYAAILLLRAHDLILRTFFLDDPATIGAYLQWRLGYRPYFLWVSGTDLHGAQEPWPDRRI